MTTAAEQAFIDAINAGATPEGIQAFSNAVAGGIPPDVAANPGGFGYDYTSDPAHLNAQRQQAFAPSDAYDYRQDPSWLALTRGFNAQEQDLNDTQAHDLGTLDILQPVTEDDIRANQEQALRRVDSNAESRGIYQSGERMLNRADTVGDYGRQLAGVELSGSLQRGNIGFDTQQSLKELARRRQEALLQYSTPPTPTAPNLSQLGG